MSNSMSWKMCPECQSPLMLRLQTTSHLWKLEVCQIQKTFFSEMLEVILQSNLELFFSSPQRTQEWMSPFQVSSLYVQYSLERTFFWGETMAWQNGFGTEKHLHMISRFWPTLLRRIPASLNVYLRSAQLTWYVAAPVAQKQQTGKSQAQLVFSALSLN